MTDHSEALLATPVQHSPNSRVAELERTLARAWTQEAFDELHALAEQGDSAAQVGLGQQYETIAAVHDPAAAAHWYRAAAAQGQWAAVLRWANLCSHHFPLDLPTALRDRPTIEAKATAGDANAAAWMGDLCRQGLAAEPDAAAANRWYRLAAGQGHVGALAQLGAMLESTAQPTDETRLEALAFWLRAGMGGDVVAQYHVGLHYRDGSGCQANPHIAARWLRAAATQGYAPAAQVLQQLESSGIVRVNQNPAAVELYVAGRGHEFLREGWGTLGIADTWTVGARAVVRLPVVARGADQLLKLEIGGIFPPWGFGMQRIVAHVGETKVGEVVCRGAATFEFFVPASVGACEDAVQVTLQLPDARSPAVDGDGDLRFLSLRVAAIELAPLADADRGPAPVTAEILQQREALMHMQSLGINCEFGFLQRACGVEPLGLFRWTFAPLVQLVPALEQEFRGLKVKNGFNIAMNEDTEFVIEDPVYGFRHHSFLFASQGATVAMVKRGEVLRVGMLTQSLLEEMRTGAKLFVYHDAGASPLAEVRRLVTALNRQGANTLLWLVGPGPGRNVGDVRLIEPGLIEGTVSGFQPSVDNIVPDSQHRASWLRVACAAYRLWRSLHRPHP